MNTKIILITTLFCAIVLANAEQDKSDEEYSPEFMDEEKLSDLAEENIIDEEEARKIMEAKIIQTAIRFSLYLVILQF
ncbi:hypothetical protein TrispH2_002920 [Trichoplax sp. H2]|nr:hypothetical protein TrispH2_002920 [Trichoplax sp. H2]|eukprot:RDD45051.1 hypothetical protein TrispH2_002920 [Trichoplax sp. H2]